MQSIKLIIFSTLYTVLVMVLVSLDGTYNITHSLFGNGNQNSYGMGMNLKNRGFYIHIFLFTILIITPMVMCKSIDS